MTALVLDQAAADFPAALSALKLIAQKELPELGDEEVQLDVRAAGLNFFELLQMVNKYQTKMPFPLIPGTEVAGVIAKVGPKVKSFAVGDEVLCMVPCGGVATSVTVHHEELIRKPAELSWAAAAAAPVAFMTVYNGLVQRGKLKKGEIVAVSGASGGMGVAAVRLASSMGCTVLALVSSPEKFATARAAGASRCVTYDNLRQVVKEEFSEGIDVAFDVVGGDVFDALSRAMAPEGRLLVVGFASGVIPSLKANLPLIKGYSVVGVRAGAEMMRSPDLKADMMTAMNRHLQAGSFTLPVTTVPLEQAAAAYTTMAQRKALGKLVIMMPSALRSRL